MHNFSPVSRRSSESLEEAMSRLYFVLKEFPLTNILLLPFLDLHMLFQFENLGRLKKLLLLSKFGSRATVMSLSKTKIVTSPIGVVYLAKRLYHFLSVRIMSYILIIPKIWEILRKRNRFVDYLQMVDLNKYSLIFIKN